MYTRKEIHITETVADGKNTGYEATGITTSNKGNCLTQIQLTEKFTNAQGASDFVLKFLNS